MTARKSFDVHAKTPQGKEKTSPRKKRRTAPEGPAPRRKKSLRTKREELRGRRNTTLLALSALALCAVVYGLWQPGVRIASVTAADTPDPEAVQAIATKVLAGSHLFVPRDSFFFYPERELRAAVLDAYPSISALTLRRTGFTSLSISASSRRSAFLWCGTPKEAGEREAEGVSFDCYETDAEGFVFARQAPSEGEEASSLLRVYATLDTASSTGSYPLRARVEGAQMLPDILRFARAISSLGIPLRAVAIRTDEADLYTAGGTRITYVVGQEKEAGRIAESTFASLNFMDGSIEYVDLRFGGKAYIKRRE
jgi:hypothetical protein